MKSENKKQKSTRMIISNCHTPICLPYAIGKQIIDGSDFINDVASVLERSIRNTNAYLLANGYKVYFARNEHDDWFAWVYVLGNRIVSKAFPHQEEIWDKITDLYTTEYHINK